MIRTLFSFGGSSNRRGITGIGFALIIAIYHLFSDYENISKSKSTLIITKYRNTASTITNTSITNKTAIATTTTTTTTKTTIIKAINENQQNESKLLVITIPTTRKSKEYDYFKVVNKATTSSSTNEKNTNWGNVEYNIGFLNRTLLSLTEKEESILRTCRGQVGISRRDMTTNDQNCFGPIQYYTDCCYCTYRGEYPIEFTQQIRKLVVSSSLYSSNSDFIDDDIVFWFCARPRNNSLSMNWTNINHYLSSSSGEDTKDSNKPMTRIIEGNDNNSHDNMNKFYDEQKILSSSLSKPSIILVTSKIGYNNKFEKHIDEYCDKQIPSIGIFQQRDIDMFCYGKLPNFIIQDKRWEQHIQFTKKQRHPSRRGGGYWFHKPVFIQYHMNQQQDGDYIVWTDRDRIDFLRQGIFNKLIETLIQRNGDLVIETIYGYGSEAVWTKEDMLVAFNASIEIRNQSTQVSANAFILKNSPQMKQLIHAWVECAADYHMVSDEPSYIPNKPIFKEHRHDQSILSLLIKTYLIRQSGGVIGPPARSYLPEGHYYTYQFPNHTNNESNYVQPYCPFASSSSSMNKDSQQQQNNNSNKT